MQSHLWTLWLYGWSWPKLLARCIPTFVIEAIEAYFQVQKIRHQELKIEESGFFISTVHGFLGSTLDELVSFKSTHKGLQSYKQESLYEHIGGKTYVAHNALADVVALQEILTAASIASAKLYYI